MSQQRQAFDAVRQAVCLLAVFATTLASIAWGIDPARAQDGSWPDTLVIGTALRGGTYDAYGRGLAALLGDKVRIGAATRETNGPEENLDLLRVGEIQIGFTTLGAALRMLKQQPQGTDNIRALAPMYETAFHFVVVSQSPAKAIRDLEGKSIGVGPRGGTAAFYVPLMMKALGINAQFVEGDWETLNNKLASSSVDLLAVAGGTPFPALLDLGRRQQIRFIPLNRDDALKIQLQVPELARTRVPLGVYPWEQTVYPTMGLFNFIAVRSDLPDSLAAAVIEALFSDNATMLEFSPAAAETLPSNYARNSILPFHSGVMRWYQHHPSFADHGD